MKPLTLAVILTIYFTTIFTGADLQSCDTPEETCDSELAALKKDGLIKYELHSNLSLEDRNFFFQAIHEIQTKTCIRFQQRLHGDPAFVKFFRNNDLSGCGKADFCRTGGVQYAILGKAAASGEECSSVVQTVLHLLGRTLCLDNVQAAKDILSVAEIDKLNEMYNCQGCYRHRWRNVKDLKGTELDSMLELGETHEGDPLYLCRVNITGEVIPGKYLKEEKTCYVPFNQEERKLLSNDVEVFTVPNTGGITTTIGHYSRIHIAKIVSNENGEYMPVRVGMTSEGVTVYAAVANIRRREDSVGKVHANKLDAGYFPFHGEEVRSTSYQLLTCHEKLKEFSEINI